MEMENSKTLVFMDLETSGLPHQVPKITEISMVAASVEHILEKHNGSSKENSCETTFLPRVLNVVNMAVYPCKAIQPAASAVSGLTNENLEHQRVFDDNLYRMMELFLERLEAPICLVAHNGNRFDYPILQSELCKIQKSLPDDIYCVDTLPGFRDVLSSPVPNEVEESRPVDDLLAGIKPLGPVSNHIPQCEWSNEEYNSELVRLTEAAEKIVNTHTYFNPEELQTKISREMERMRRRNESTPLRNNRSGRVPNTPTKESRRNILQEKPKRMYNLGALYASLIGKEMVSAHRAQADCTALLECVTAVGRPILEWLDANKVPFRSVRRMW